MKYDVVIAGAGLAGITSARLLAEAGKKVLIVEQRKHTAGNCFDSKNNEGITIHHYGPHIFHTNNKQVWDFLNKFTDFNSYQHRVLSYVHGKYIPLPIGRDTITELFGINLSINEVNDFLKKEVSHSSFNPKPENFRDAMVSQIGEGLYELFIKNYTEKQWGMSAENLSANLAGRIPIRANRDTRYFTDKYQGLPSNGFAKMADNMLNHPNIIIMLGADYFKVKDDIDTDLTVYTGELDKFFDYKYGKLEYRSLEFEYKTYDQEYYQSATVINYPNDYDYTRVTEYKHFLSEKTEKTTLCYEYSKANGIPYYVVPTQENTDKRNLYITEVEKLEATKKYIFIGRLAEYKYYNMDQVISASIKKIEHLSYNLEIKGESR